MWQMGIEALAKNQFPMTSFGYRVANVCFFVTLLVSILHQLLTECPYVTRSLTSSCLLIFPHWRGLRSLRWPVSVPGAASVSGAGAASGAGAVSVPGAGAVSVPVYVPGAGAVSVPGAGVAYVPGPGVVSVLWWTSCPYISFIYKTCVS